MGRYQIAADALSKDIDEKKEQQDVLPKVAEVVAPEMELSIPDALYPVGESLGQSGTYDEALILPGQPDDDSEDIKKLKEYYQNIIHNNSKESENAKHFKKLLEANKIQAEANDKLRPTIAILDAFGGNEDLKKIPTPEKEREEKLKLLLGLEKVRSSQTASKNNAAGRYNQLLGFQYQKRKAMQSLKAKNSQMKDKMFDQMNEDAGMPMIAQQILHAIRDNKGLFQNRLPVINSIKLSPLGRALDDDLANLDNLMKQGRQVIGKFLEGGVLRKEDDRKYNLMLPNLEKDNYEQALKKAQRFEKILRQKFEGKVAGLAAMGYDVKPLEAMGINVKAIIQERKDKDMWIKTAMNTYNKSQGRNKAKALAVILNRWEQGDFNATDIANMGIINDPQESIYAIKDRVDNYLAKTRSK